MVSHSELQGIMKSHKCPIHEMARPGSGKDDTVLREPVLQFLPLLNKYVKAKVPGVG